VLGCDSLRLICDIAATFNPKASSKLPHPLTEQRFEYVMYNMLASRAGVRKASGNTIDLMVPGEQKVMAKDGMLVNIEWI
jgi:hypothetical protein